MDLLEEEMAICSSILPWEIPWAEEPGWLKFMRSQQVRYDCPQTHRHIHTHTGAHTHTLTHTGTHTQSYLHLEV